MEYIIFALGYIVLGYVIYRLMKSVESLTSKLMARDYKEYVSMNQAPVEAPRKTRKPLSWYDDGDIEDEVAN